MSKSVLKHIEKLLEMPSDDLWYCRVKVKWIFFLKCLLRAVAVHVLMVVMLCSACSSRLLEHLQEHSFRAFFQNILPEHSFGYYSKQSIREINWKAPLFSLIWFDLTWFDFIQFDVMWCDLIWSDFFYLMQFEMVWFDLIPL